MQETQEMQVPFLGWEDPLEKGMATHSNIFSLENPMERGTWQATIHGVTKSWTRLSTRTHTHIYTTNVNINTSIIIPLGFFKSSLTDGD